jgi:cysteine synthase A
MAGAIAKAEELLAENDDYFMPQQFKNPANPEVHRRTTAREIWNATDGNIDAFVAGVGTGGTLTGVGEVIKKKKPDIHLVAIEPTGSPVLSGGKPGPHKIQGIGAGFIPDVLNKDQINEVIQVDNEVAYDYGRRLAREEGILSGISTGAICYGALQVAKKLGPGKTVVFIVCDNGERYLTHEMYQEPATAGAKT